MPQTQHLDAISEEDSDTISEKDLDPRYLSTVLDVRCLTVSWNQEEHRIPLKLIKKDVLASTLLYSPTKN